MQLRCIAIAACLVTAACADDVSIDADPDGHVTIGTGAYGVARHLTGNHQPGTGTPSGTTEPASGRVVRIHAPTSAGDTTEVTSPTTYGRYLVNTSVIANTRVDAHGFFQVALEPGTYSVFISDGDAWFCNGGDLVTSRMCPLQVAAGAATRFDIDVNYEAAF